MGTNPTIYWTIDRMVAGTTVLEDGDGATVSVPTAWLPGSAREGDVLRLERPEPGEGGDASHLHFVIDPAEAERRRDANRSTRDSLPRGPSGDIDL